MKDNLERTVCVRTARAVLCRLTDADLRRYLDVETDPILLETARDVMAIPALRIGLEREYAGGLAPDLRAKVWDIAYADGDYPLSAVRDRYRWTINIIRMVATIADKIAPRMDPTLAEMRRVLDLVEGVVTGDIESYDLIQPTHLRGLKNDALQKVAIAAARRALGGDVVDDFLERGVRPAMSNSTSDTILAALANSTPETVSKALDLAVLYARRGPYQTRLMRCEEWRRQLDDINAAASGPNAVEVACRFLALRPHEQRVVAGAVGFGPDEYLCHEDAYLAMFGEIGSASFRIMLADAVARAAEHPPKVVGE